MSDSALMENYRRLPIAFERGAGAWLYDQDGRAYLDALTGLAVCGLGHAHPDVTAAIAAQAGSVLHTSNIFRIPQQERLGRRLCDLAGMDRVFFCNSGAEANEAAIKIARLHGHNRGIEVPSIIVTEGSFHGRTMATLTATGNRKVQAGFEPLLSGFVRVPYDDLDSVRRVAATRSDVVAILVEPIQGEGGIQIPGDDYLPGLRELCDANGWLLMLDEVQTGNGRTGDWYACQGQGVVPDVLTTAKGLGNGVPIGACMARGAAAGVLVAGTHGSTFGGNPLVCAAGNAVIDVIERDGLLARARELGTRMLDGLRKGLAGDNRVADIRGRGLMLAVEMRQPCPDLVQRGLERGIVVNVTHDTVVRMLPPLILTDAEADRVVADVIALVHASG